MVIQNATQDGNTTAHQDEVLSKLIELVNRHLNQTANGTADPIENSQTDAASNYTANTTNSSSGNQTATNTTVEPDNDRDPQSLNVDVPSPKSHAAVIAGVIVPVSIILIGGAAALIYIKVIKVRSSALNSVGSAQARPDQHVSDLEHNRLETNDQPRVNSPNPNAEDPERKADYESQRTNNVVTQNILIDEEQPSAVDKEKVNQLNNLNRTDMERSIIGLKKKTLE